MKIKTGLRYALRPAHVGLFIWCALAALFCVPVHAQSPQLGAGQVLGNTTATRRPAQAVGLSALFDRAFCSTANSALARISGSWTCLATANNSVWATNGSGVPSLTQTLPSAVQDNITRLGTITSGVWNGTAPLVTSGGTGATSAAGARANLGLGTISTQDASNVAITGGTITGIPNPTVNSDVANKAYADAIASGISPRPSVVLATAAVLPNSPTYSNGASGVGATLTAGSNAALVVDGTTPSASARVLVKDQASALQNGVYTVTTVGSGAAAWVLTRAADFDQPSEMTAGAAFAVTAGTANIGTGWTLAATVTTVGTTSASFNLYQSIAGALLVASNLSDLNNPATARTNLGLGTMATQNSNSVSITGGTVAGSTLIGTLPSAVQDNITRLGTIASSPVRMSTGASGASPVSGTVLALETPLGGYLSLLAPNASEAGIIFGNPASSISGWLLYNNSSVPNGLSFRTNGSTVAALDSSGRFSIGTLSATAQLDTTSTVRFRNYTCAGAGGPVQVDGSGNLGCAVTGAVLVTNAPYSATCNGSTDDTTAIQSAVSAGFSTVQIPAGKTCIIDSVTLVNNLVVEGAGPSSILKRKNSASNTTMLVGDGLHNITVRKLTLDGNKANNTAAGGGASFQTSAYDIHFESVTLKNMKYNAGVGWGVNLDTSADAANHTASTFKNVSCVSNDAAGILMKKVFNVVVDGMYSYDCQMAALLDSTVGGNHESGNVSFTNINVDCNSVASSSSVEVLGGANSTGVLGSVYSNTIRQTWNVTIDNLQVKNCKSYGLVVQAKYATISGLQINSLDNASPGGVLLNALETTLVNSNISVANLSSYTIDAGGCSYCVISDNRIDGINLNMGASQYSTVANNVISGANGNLIAGSIYDSDGTSIGAFPWAGTDLKLIGNKLLCGSSCVGVAISDGFPNLYLSGNGVSGTTTPFLVIGYPVFWGGQNIDMTAASANGNMYVLTAATDLVIPEDARSVYLTGATGVNTIRSVTQNIYKNGLYAVLITNHGTAPYSSTPTVTQTGGTCSVAPTFTVALDGNGFVAMIRINNPGTCTVIPTGVSISGGGGAGATASVRAQPVPTTNGLSLNLVTQSAINLGGGGGTNVFPRAAIAPSVAGGVYQFLNTFGGWGQPQ